MLASKIRSKENKWPKRENKYIQIGELGKGDPQKIRKYPNQLTGHMQGPHYDQKCNCLAIFAKSCATSISILFFAFLSSLSFLLFFTTTTKTKAPREAATHGIPDHLQGEEKMKYDGKNEDEYVSQDSRPISPFVKYGESANAAPLKFAPEMRVEDAHSRNCDEERSEKAQSDCPAQED